MSDSSSEWSAALEVHRLELDLEERADGPHVSGIIVPYGVLSGPIAGGGREQFSPGAWNEWLELYAAGTADPVSLTSMDHRTTLGVLVAADDRPDGLWARFRIVGADHGGPVAEALDQIEAGALWGFSVGFTRGGEGQYTDSGTVTDHTGGCLLNHAAVCDRPAYTTTRVLLERNAAMSETTITDPAAEPTAGNGPPEWADRVTSVETQLELLTRSVDQLPGDLGDRLEADRAHTTEVDVEALEIRTAGAWLHHKARARSGDVSSRDKIARTMEAVPELRALDAASSDTPDDVPGAVPRIYLRDLIELNRVGAPIAAAIAASGQRLPMPPTGEKIERPEVTQGTTAAWETAQGDEGGSQQFLVGTNDSAVKMLKTRNRLTLQAAERTSPSVTDALLRDQTRVIATTLDTGLLSGAGTVDSVLGAPEGMLSVSGIGTDAISAWTTAGLLASVGAGIEAIYAATNMPPAFMVWHSRRFVRARILADSSARPIFDVGAGGQAVNTLGSMGQFRTDGDAGRAAQPTTASIMGVPIVVSNSVSTGLGVGTDEDIITMVGYDTLDFHQADLRRLQLQVPDDFQTSYGAAQMCAFRVYRAGGIFTITGLTAAMGG